MRSPEAPQDAPPFLSGGGVAGELARSVDWSKTPLGPAASWPRSLKTVVAMILRSRHPMFLWWGPELIQFYNDAYLPSFGTGKHPAAMGQPGRECWQEIWPLIWPQIDDVMGGRRSSWNEDQLVPIFRNGRIEEVYWTYGYSAVLDDTDRIGGTLVVCTETTRRVIADRRSGTLRSLSEKTAWLTDSRLLVSNVATAMQEAPADIPFGLFYTVDPTSEELRLIESFGFDDGNVMESVDVAVRRHLAFVDHAADAQARPRIRRVELVGLPGGPWPEPSPGVLIAELSKAPQGRPHGFVVLGLSPRLSFDDDYRNHLEQVVANIGSTQARVDAFRIRAATEDERNTLLLQLEATSRAKDEFLAMLGHELRNPLSPIVTALRLMESKGDASTSKERAVIERHVEHLTRLVDDLLDVSRISRGKIELRRETVEIAEVIDKAVEMASVLVGKRSHRLSVEVPRTGLPWSGDPTRLAQVVANLLTNAARYTPPNGDIALRARREGERREGGGGGGMITISVRDNGVGIAPEMLPRIFDLFVQEERGKDRFEGGLGIGLTLVKKLVALHGGNVEARSEGPGKGSEFVITLPGAAGAGAAATTGAATSTTTSTTTATTTTTKRILVVDDNEDAADLLAEALRMEGYEVSVANDPVVALNMAEQFRPQIAILDIGLPGMDGYQLGARLRALPETAGCRLIALTGYGQEHDRVKSREGGFETHLVKPVDLDTLITAVALRLDAA